MVVFICESLISELRTWVHYQPNTTKYLPPMFPQIFFNVLYSLITLYINNYINMYVKNSNALDCNSSTFFSVVWDLCLNFSFTMCKGNGKHKSWMYDAADGWHNTNTQLDLKSWLSDNDTAHCSFSIPLFCSVSL